MYSFDLSILENRVHGAKCVVNMISLAEILLQLIDELGSLVCVYSRRESEYSEPLLMQRVEN